MYFDHVYITAEGYDLLGAATAGSNSQKITWENAITSNIDITGWTLSDINSATSDGFPTNTYTSSGAVTSAVHSQKDITVDGQNVKVDVVTVTVDINNNDYYGLARTLCVFAKLDDGESKLVIVASADNPETIHSSGSQPYNAIIDLYIELSGTAVSEVSADQSWYATASAFNALSSRVVTTHSEDSQTAGENQDIYGVKTFKNDMHTSNVTPSNNLGADLGDSGHKYKSVFVRSVNQSAMVCLTAADDSAKTIPVQLPLFIPTQGDRILVKFNNGNSHATPTIKIGSGATYTIDGLRTNLEENAIVPMTFNGSSWDVDGVSSVANQVALSLNNKSSDYSVVFTEPSGRTVDGVPVVRDLCIDVNTATTSTNLKYNPGTNTLSTSNLACENLEATGNLACENLEVSGNFDLNYPAVVALAELFGIKLNIIRVYRASLNGGSELTFSADDEIEFGEGGATVGSATSLSNYTICRGDTPYTRAYLPGTFRITKVISSGITSSVRDALTDITVDNTTYTKCANPSFGTPCTCLAIKIS